MHTWNTFHGRRFARPAVAALAVLAVMGGGLAAGAQASDTLQTTADTLQTAAAPYSQINGGGGSTRSRG